MNRPTPNQLKRLVKRETTPELAELLLPVIHWRHSKNGVMALLPNPVWSEVFEKYIHPWLADYLSPDWTLEWRTRDQVEEVDQQERHIGFEKFLQDPGNELAHQACKRIIESPGLEHNPLYIHGPSGCGKTHLLKSTAREYQEILGDESVLWLDGPEFVSQQAQELQQRGRNELREHIRSAALIVFDQLDSLAGRTLAQEELFHIINTCLENGQQILLAGLRSPRALVQIEDRLSTRLSWGLAVPIEPPLIETRLALLRVYCQDLLDEYNPDRLAQFVENQAPDMHHVKTLSERILKEDDIFSQPDAVSFDRILEVTCAHFNLRTGDIIGKKRTRPIAHARQTVLLLARRLTKHKLESLGSLVGGRDHSTVIYSLRQAEERCEEDERYEEEIRELTQQILAN